MIILAAGLSERMGVFKPLLPVGGQPAMIRCIEAAKASRISDITIVSGHSSMELEAVLRASAPDVRVVHNSGYLDGMFSSARAGVSAIPDGSDGFFLLPADCCAVSADNLMTLMRRFAENDGAYVTRPKFESRRGHPPLIPARYIRPLLSYNGENGLKGFLSPLPTDEVMMEDRGALLDMDTPEDYAELLDHLGFPAYPSREQCAVLLEKYSATPEIIVHGERVAALALKLASLMNGREASVDVALLESACLLHDIMRTGPDHARMGMELLLREGYPKAAIIVGSHMDMPGDITDVGEKELLYLSDKLCRRGGSISLEDTMRELESRFAGDLEALRSARGRIKTAQAIFDKLMARYNIGYDDIFR